MPAEPQRNNPSDRGQQVTFDDSNVNTAYSNFCRVTGNPEELIIEFALNPQAVGIPDTPIPLFQRTVVSFFTAKRLLHALEMTIQRHESKYGEIEMNPQRRIQQYQQQQANQNK